MSSPDWRDVTRAEPCPACGKGDWCGRSIEGDAIHCHRVTEPPTGFKFVKTTDSGGTVFRPIGSRLAKPNRSPNPRGRSDDSSLRDFGPIVEEIRSRSAANLAEWAELLGVRGESLERFGAFSVSREDLRLHRFGFDGGVRPDVALAHPEFDGSNAVRGIGARTLDNCKGTAKGSKRGLARPLAPLDRLTALYCTEGTSDAWALDSIGLQALARPNNSARGHVEDWLVETLRPHRGGLVFLLDRKKGEQSLPLINSLARRLHRPIQYEFPPDHADDCRAWLGVRIVRGWNLANEADRGAARIAFESAIGGGE